MEVEVQFEGQSIILTYNSQTGCFEGILNAPSQGGAKNIIVSAEDYIGNIITETYKKVKYFEKKYIRLWKCTFLSAIM